MAEGPVKSVEFLDLAEKVDAFQDYVGQHHKMFSAVLRDYARRSLTNPEPDVQPPSILGVSVTKTATTIALTWQTNEPCQCTVQVGSVVETTDLGTAHQVTFDGLTPSTSYVVTIDAMDVAGNASQQVQSVTTDKATQPQLGYLTISQFGITWTFDKEYPAGQYANGDWWVVGPANIIGISPASVDVGGGQVRHGSMINPSPKHSPYNGYDWRILSDLSNHEPGWAYRPAYNVAFGVSPSKPLVLQPGSSLVSTISLDAVEVRTVLKTCAILTAVDKAPNPGAFRPPYCGTDKTSKFHVDQLNYGILQKVALVPGGPTMAQAERWLERPWLDHGTNWMGERTHPKDNMLAYGRDMSAQMGAAALMLHADVPDEQKRTLMIRMVQLGIDLMGIIKDGGHEAWPGAGGLGSGRFWPIVFAGLALGDAEMRDVRKYRVNLKPVWFGETQQTFYVPPTYVGSRGYTLDMVSKPEWGIKHENVPSEDNASWSASYRQCCTANAWFGSVLAARMTAGGKAACAHDAWFDYQDRYLAVQEKLGQDWKLSWDPWSLAMYRKYRGQF